VHLGQADFLVDREIVGAKGVMQQFADQGAHIVVPGPRHERGDEARQMVRAPIPEHG
jgi:hypothetical protein